MLKVNQLPIGKTVYFVLGDNKLCGIAGIYGEGGKSDIKEMVSVLKHRGYDGEGSYTDDRCALGHCRLAIIDLSSKGHQPMCNEDKTVWLVVNGEIYNYKDLRVSLQSKGHLFQSESDSEVIIHAYEEYGEDFVAKLRGMFALAVYDAKKNKVVLARDPIGKKPLYYYQDKDKLVFASEIKALFKAGVPCEVNYDMIPSYLMYQYTIGTDTLFKGIHKLPAGCMLIADASGMKVKRYWELSDDGLYMGSWGEPVSHLRELLEESVKLRLQSDVPVGSFLSGGIDSSVVTALYRKFYGGDLHTFTATFDTNSEAEYAKLVSKHLGTIYHEVEITDDMVIRDIEKITWHHDEPLGDAATINNYYLAKEAKKYVTVVLAGEGGDELFGGYPWYHYSGYISVMSRIPRPLRIIGQYVIDDGNITSKGYGFNRKASFGLQGSLVEMQLYPTTAMNRQNIKWLTNLLNGLNCHPVLSELVSNHYNRMLAMDCLNKLPEQYLMKADKGTMAWAIEERLPLLDKEIIEYAFAIPPKLKRDKYVLRKATEDLLPQEIIWRKKKGFGTPITDWLNNGLKEMAMDRLRNGALLKEICKKKSLEKVVGLLDKGLGNNGVLALNPANVVWSLVALQIWWEVWFGK